MSLRTKNLLVVGAVQVCLLVVVSVVLSQVALGAVQALERRSAEADLARVVSALSAEVDHVNTTAIDWAQWDDAYAFVQDRDPAFVTANLGDSSIAKLEINVILFFDANRQYIFGKAVDLPSGADVPVAPDLLAYLAAHPALLQHAGPADSRVGILAVPGSALLVASQPILTSQGQGPVHGTVVVGRYLDAAELGALARQSQVAVYFRGFDDPALPADFVSARAALSSQSAALLITPSPALELPSGDDTLGYLPNRPVFVQNLSTDSVAAYAALQDITGQPALLLRVEGPRPIYQQGLSAIRYFVGVLVLIGLAFGLIMLFALQKTVISPLTRLSRAVAGIGASSNPAGRVLLAGRDEVGQLATSINGMLAAIEQAQRGRRETDERYAATVEQAAEGIFLFDAPTRRLMHANSAFLALTGYSAAEIPGLTLYDVVAEDAATIDARIEQVLGEGRVPFAERRYRCKDGSLVDVESSDCLINLEGQPALVGLVHDISLRKQAEQALQRYADRLTLLHEMDQAIVASQPPERIADLALRALAKLVPYWIAHIAVFDADITEATALASRGEGLARLPAGFRNPPPAAYATLQRGEARVMDDFPALPGVPPALLALKAAGLRSFVEVPMLDEGKFFGVLRLGADRPRAFTPDQVAIARELADQVAIAISQSRLRTQVQGYTAELEQRVAERTAELSDTAARLQAANVQLKSLDELKSQFVSNVSHELRTPLANIKLYLSLLENGKPEKHDRYMATLKREADLLHRLIEDLLHLSRLDTGKVRPSLAQVDVNDLLHTLANDRGELLAGWGLGLDLDFDPGLPPLLADARMVTQVVTNLMSNAMNYTPSGGTITVRTQCRQESGALWVGLAVADTGPGISAEEQEHLFERFFRGEAALQSKAPGSGLGLAICHEIVRLHGGRMAVESQPGRGSTFTAWLPAAGGTGNGTDDQT